MPIADYWKLVLIELEQTVSTGKYKAWLENLEFVSTSERSTAINLLTISRFAKEYIENKLEKQLLVAIKKYFTKVIKINIKVCPKLEKIEEFVQNKIEVPNQKQTDREINQKNNLEKELIKNSKSNYQNLSQNSWQKSSLINSPNWQPALEQNEPFQNFYNSKNKLAKNKNEIDKNQNQEIFVKRENSEESKKIEFEKKDWQINQNNQSNSQSNSHIGVFPAQNLNNLNSKYTFENLVVSGYNELAVAVAKSILKELGTLYNPVFIYSKVGLGKTHLLQAIGHKALENEPNLKIKYATCETFFNHYLTGIQKNQSVEFRRHYRDVDLLLLDDIQFINGKNSTQEAFFHTFNELHQQNKQIIITSDKHPDELGLIEERLISRFKWGMVVDLSAPNLEDRIAILKDKTERQKIPLDGQQIIQIAQKITSNIRELEGILNQIKLKIQIEKDSKSSDKDEINIDENWLNSILESEEKNSTNFNSKSTNLNLTDKVIQLVAQNYKINSRQIFGPSRDQKTSEARQIVMYIWYKNFNLSLGVIARMLGKKNHTTVLHGVSKIEKELIQNTQFQDKFNQIIKNLN